MRHYSKLNKISKTILQNFVGQKRKLYSYLVSKQHHDGISARTGGSVLDSEGVIVILDDVKVNVCLGRADHPWGTLDSNADVP